MDDSLRGLAQRQQNDESDAWMAACGVLFTVVFLFSGWSGRYPPVVDSTTEWYGDLRAGFNPPRSPPFYDVIYDDAECPFGVESDAIPDYVYFGQMVASMSVPSHATCLMNCIENPRCVSVNFFEPMAFQKKGFCELLAENQLDNPRLMRPFQKAVYYENIKCRTEEEFVSPTNVASRKFRVKKPTLHTNDEYAAVFKKLARTVKDYNTQFRLRRH
ncbi:hypothetical protein AB6A40_004279 [Gnathostoma spinigerum]|uniref:Apple domain-containing protein n=1 Tax=Gnathostoma spinigerum TaxID=75299 RepID=A0ABD6EC11_9BILA